MLGELKAPLAASAVKTHLNSEAGPIVVFYYHKAVGQHLLDTLSEFNPAFVSGSTSFADRASAIDRFQDLRETDLFLAQISTMNAGVTLTSARHVMIVEPDWTPAVNVQAIQRCHRIGVTGHVLAQLFCVDGSLDAAIVATVERKTRELMEVLR